MESRRNLPMLGAMISDLLPTLGTAYVASEWIIRFLMLVVVPLRRTAEATRSWLLLIFFLPIPGLLLYLAIGRPRFPQWRIDRARRLAPFVRRVSDDLAAAGDGADISEPLPALVLSLGGLPATAGNAIEFLDEYDATIDRLVLLAAPGFEVVERWRIEQENDLRRRLETQGPDAGRAMTDAEVATFIQHYERLTRHVLATMPACADRVLRLDETRRLKDLA